MLAAMVTVVNWPIFIKRRGLSLKLTIELELELHRREANGINTY